MRDTNHLLSLLLQVWFWVTPIVYSLDLVPERFRMLALVNPLTLFVTTFHQIVVGLEFPDISRLAVLLVQTAVVFVVGYVVFMRGNARMAEYV